LVILRRYGLGMYRKIQIVFDCADPAVMMAFWGPALGYLPEPPPPGYASWADFAADRDIPRSEWHGALQDPAGEGPRLFFQIVPEPKTVKNRVHLDIGVTPRRGTVAEQRGPIAAKVAELVALGATEVETIEEGGGMFTVMRDPEGNEFCVH
jgi:hypothetical protein